ncbi:hypothetical protein H2200_006455 [Cladophialophora chaetospira]|uniref:Uncharacterized protein n=1 Tax=Cladophialophora chaetospira TaxID=386627 RepID=A0AA39CHW3_9EURO|nr:hypothetical protein H2200_006455 [Cladophialophora chaetospira]
MSPAFSPSRLALGPKDLNAVLKKQQTVFKMSTRAPEAATSVASLLSAKRPLSPTMPPTTSPRAGQKRKISEIPNSDQSDSQETTSGPLLSQITDTLSDTQSQSDIEESAGPSMTRSKSTLNTSFTSFKDSQEDAPQVEPEFHILEEPSQRTLDTMHAITFPQSTSQLVPPLRPNLRNETSQLSVSMSSLIDFDNDRSSQDDGMPMIEDNELPPSSEKKQETEEEARREMMHEKAETLRTRLQLAFYKIQTHQITSPFARLQKPRSPSPCLPAASSSPRSSSTVRPDDPVQHVVMSPESRVALARARATSGPRPSVRSLSALPTPQIAPTTFSARWNDEIGTHQRSHPTERSNIPSSPPLSPADDTILDAHTLRPPQGADPHTPLQLSSPIARRPARAGPLTSSVVKGEAANSLLELVRGARSGTSGMHGL